MIVKGYASTTGIDAVRHVIAKDAFAASIAKRGISGPAAVKLLAFHKTDQPVGGIRKLESRTEGLWIEADIDEAISYGKDLAAATKAAGGLSFSVGFFLEDADIAEDASGREYLLILKGDLFEVSVVTFPANEDAVMDFKATPTLSQLAEQLQAFNQSMQRNAS